MNNDIYAQWVTKLEKGTNIVLNDSVLIQLGKDLGDYDQIPMPGIRRMDE